MSKINKVLYNVDQRDSTKGEPTTADERRIARKNLGLDEVVGQNATSQESGIAPLDANGKVPAVHLPSYVDDIVDGYYYDGSFYEEAGHTTAIPGETGKIYVDITSGGDNTSYRYDGTHFVQISAQNTYSKVAFKGSGASSATTIASTQVSDTFQFTSGEGINLSQVGSSKELKIDVDFGSGNSGKSVIVASSGVATVSDLSTSDPNASGNSLTFIDTISQDAKGKIAPTKKTVTVDTVFAATGTNPVSGIAVANAISTKVSNTDYASSSQYGLVKLGSDTQQTVAAGNVTATADRTYAVQKNSSGQLVVNVPWTPDGTPVNDGTLTIQKNGTQVATFGANQGSNTTANIITPKIYADDSEYGTDYYDVAKFRVIAGTGLTESYKVVDFNNQLDVDETISIDPKPTSADAGKMFSVDSNGNTCWSNVPEEPFYVDISQQTATIPQILNALSNHKMVFTVVTYDSARYLLPLKKVTTSVAEFSSVIDMDSNGVTELYATGAGIISTRRHTNSLSLYKNSAVSRDDGGHLRAAEGEFYTCFPTSSVTLMLDAAVKVGGAPMYDYPIHTILQVGVGANAALCSSVTLEWYDEALFYHNIVIKNEVGSSNSEYYHVFDITVQAVEDPRSPGTYRHVARVYDLPCAFRDRADLANSNPANSNIQIGLDIADV